MDIRTISQIADYIESLAAARAATDRGSPVEHLTSQES